jgi:hypothetical protein
VWKVLVGSPIAKVATEPTSDVKMNVRYMYDRQRLSHAAARITWRR